MPTFLQRGGTEGDLLRKEVHTRRTGYRGLVGCSTSGSSFGGTDQDGWKGCKEGGGGGRFNTTSVCLGILGGP